MCTNNTLTNYGARARIMTIQWAKKCLEFRCIKTTALPVKARGMNITGIHCAIYME
jgi:hypothetical protein